MRRVVIGADDWLWLLDAGVKPADGALEAMHGALGRLAFPTPPSLLSGRVVGPDGQLDQDSLPIPETHRIELILSALEAGCVALIMARAGSLLVREGALRQAGLRATPGREPEWTARLAAQAPAVLVPESLAVRRDPKPRTPLMPRLGAHARMLRAAPAHDRAWLAYHVIERELAGGPRSYRQGRRAP